MSSLNLGLNVEQAASRVPMLRTFALEARDELSPLLLQMCDYVEWLQQAVVNTQEQANGQILSLQRVLINVTQVLTEVDTAFAPDPNGHPLEALAINLASLLRAYRGKTA